MNWGGVLNSIFTMLDSGILDHLPRHYAGEWRIVLVNTYLHKHLELSSTYKNI